MVVLAKIKTKISLSITSSVLYTNTILHINYTRSIGLAQRNSALIANNSKKLARSLVTKNSVRSVIKCINV